MPFLFFLLQAAPSPTGSFLSGVLPIVLMIAIFYFLVFMPMRSGRCAAKDLRRHPAAGPASTQP